MYRSWMCRIAFLKRFMIEEMAIAFGPQQMTSQKGQETIQTLGEMQ